MTRKILVIVSVGLIVAFGGYQAVRPAPSSATKIFRSERVFSQQSLSMYAEAIVIGQIGESTTWTDRSTDAPVVLTDWTVRSLETLKGNVPNQFTLTTVGGQKTGEQTVLDEKSDVQTGQTMLLFLTHEARHDRWIPLSLRQGVLRQQHGTFIDLTGRRYPEQELRNSIQQAGPEIKSLKDEER